MEQIEQKYFIVSTEYVLNGWGAEIRTLQIIHNDAGKEQIEAYKKSGADYFVIPKMPIQSL